MDKSKVPRFFGPPCMCNHFVILTVGCTVIYRSVWHGNSCEH